jgi:hypothetical protein
MLNRRAKGALIFSIEQGNCSIHLRFRKVWIVALKR